jgi:uncharacterized membrane protein (UPF0127 family)
MSSRYSGPLARRNDVGSLAPENARTRAPMRGSLLLSLWVLGSATCQRVDEPTPPSPLSEPPPTATSSPTTPTTPPTPTPTPTAPPTTPMAGTPDAGACVTPIAEPPPPTATPAKTCPTDTETMPPALGTGTIAFPEAPGAPTVKVEVARSADAVRRGLMYRTKLPAEEGMIFVFPDQRLRRFWMKNTCIPLDMLFIAADGTVAGILEQVPVLNEVSRGVPCPATYVLEMNAGWARRHGVKPGMKTNIEL